MRPVWPLFCTLQFYFNAARIFRTCALVPEQPCCPLPCLIFLLSKIPTLELRVQSYLLTYKNATNYDETWSHLLDLVWSRKMLFISTWGSQIRLHNRNWFSISRICILDIFFQFMFELNAFNIMAIYLIIAIWFFLYTILRI